MELDRHGVEVDVVHLNDSLTKKKKTGFMELFTRGIQINGFKGRVMMVNAAANLGMEHHECEFVLIFE